MFRFFESLTQPFPPEPPTQPPSGLYAFCRHYTQGMEPWLVLLSCLSAIVAFFEAGLFWMLGQLVDWLVEQNPDTLIARRPDPWPTVSTAAGNNQSPKHTQHLSLIHI